MLLHIFLIIGFLSCSFVLAQDSAAVACNSWETKVANAPGQKATLRLSITKKGQKRLEWSTQKLASITLSVYKAKGPVNRKGEIEVWCSIVRVYTFSNSTGASLQDIDMGGHSNTTSHPDLTELGIPSMDPGYYAMQVKINGKEAEEGDFSNWIVIKTE